MSNEQPMIIRTERGLTISGTRITLYDVMDYVTAQYPPKFIRSLFDLTEEQIAIALLSNELLNQLNPDYLIYHQTETIRFGDLPLSEQQAFKQALSEQTQDKLVKYQF